jgi:broad specificity phosphatase PhoE
VSPTPPAPDHSSSGGRLLLVRHGRTEWSRTGQHTGRTDVPLDEVGERQAAALPTLLSELTGGRAPALVLASPLQRAWRTAELAGLGDHQRDPDLQEWDYGAYEGLTTPQIRSARGDDWRVFRDGVAPGAPGQFPGESLQDVAERCARVLDRARPALARGDVVLVAHGHVLRVLATVWLEATPAAGAQLLLDPASVCVLDAEHGVPGVRHWNLSPALFQRD